MNEIITAHLRVDGLSFCYTKECIMHGIYGK